MNAATRLTSYVVGLAVVLTAGWLIGDRTGLGDVEPAASHGHTESDDGHAAGHDADAQAGAGTAIVPAGLQVSEGGYTLDLDAAGRAPGRQQLGFRIIGPEGEPLVDYEESHEKRLHLIAVRRDFVGFQHVHPVLDESTGTWTVDLDLDPGTWRVFADFVPGGSDADEGLTLGADLLVSGNPGKQSLPESERTDQVDGYTVTVAGNLAPGEHSALELEVTKDGKPVTDLQPYLGAYGHLVALREGDLAYLHVHPGGEPGDGVTEPGPMIEFGAEVPSTGRYHLFLDFKVDGRVHTAELTLDAGTAGTAGSGGSSGHDDHDH